MFAQTMMRTRPLTVGLALIVVLSGCVAPTTNSKGTDGSEREVTQETVGDPEVGFDTVSTLSNDRELDELTSNDTVVVRLENNVSRPITTNLTITGSAPSTAFTLRYRNGSSIEKAPSEFPRGGWYVNRRGAANVSLWANVTDVDPNARPLYQVQVHVPANSTRTLRFPYPYETAGEPEVLFEVRRPGDEMVYLSWSWYCQTRSRRTGGGSYAKESGKVREAEMEVTFMSPTVERREPDYVYHNGAWGCSVYDE